MAAKKKIVKKTDVNPVKNVAKKAKKAKTTKAESYTLTVNAKKGRVEKVEKTVYARPKKPRRATKKTSTVTPSFDLLKKIELLPLRDSRSDREVKVPIIELTEVYEEPSLRTRVKKSIDRFLYYWFKKYI